MLIRLRDITKVYRVGTETIRALDGVDLDVGPNEYVAIMGSSGSGKSTMMNILGCLDVPSSGRYTLDGIDVSKLRDNKLAAIRNTRIGFVFQSFNLIPRTSALRNVELPLIYAGERSGRRERARAALERVGLGQRADHLPNQLSGGQQQRVAVARALVTNPAIILADEPTGNLHSEQGREIMELFTELNRAGTTIIQVTHSEQNAAYSQRIIRLRDGWIEGDEKVSR